MDDIRASLATELRSSHDELLRAISALDPADLERGRYENGWNGRQILAHLAAIEWTYPRLIDLARTARPEQGESGRADGSARDGMDGYNARQVAKRDAVPVPELLDEFSRNRLAFIAAIEAADLALLEAPVRSAGGRVGPLAQVLRDVSLGHVSTHLADLLAEAR
jgi:hypothetical protein